MKNTFICAFIIISSLNTGCKKEETTPQVIHIGALGDSITRGVDGANIPSSLDALLPENYIVSNYGVSGTCMVKNCFSPIWDESRFSDLVLDAPDIVTIMFGTNDCNPTNSEAVRSNFDHDYRDMIDLLQRLPSKPRILLCYPPPAYDEWNIIDSLIRTEIIPIIDNIASDYDLDVADT